MTWVDDTLTLAANDVPQVLRAMCEFPLHNEDLVKRYFVCWCLPLCDLPEFRKQASDTAVLVAKLQLALALATRDLDDLLDGHDAPGGAARLAFALVIAGGCANALGWNAIAGDIAASFDRATHGAASGSPADRCEQLLVVPTVLAGSVAAEPLRNFAILLTLDDDLEDVYQDLRTGRNTWATRRILARETDYPGSVMHDLIDEAETRARELVASIPPESRWIRHLIDVHIQRRFLTVRLYQ